MDYKTVINFWFEEITAKDWWQKNTEFDALILQRFLTVHQQAIAGELFAWRATAQGRLAEIIVLDQFSRNIFRESAFSFYYDPIALVLAQEAIAAEADMALTPTERSFLYMPYMHSESLLIHQQAEGLFNQPGMEGNYKFELEHKAIIERFGRYPHRNKILNRQSSEEELAFLANEHAGF